MTQALGKEPGLSFMFSSCLLWYSDSYSGTFSPLQHEEPRPPVVTNQWVLETLLGGRVATARS